MVFEYTQAIMIVSFDIIGILFCISVITFV